MATAHSAANMITAVTRRSRRGVSQDQLLVPSQERTPVAAAPAVVAVTMH